MVASLWSGFSCRYSCEHDLRIKTHCGKTNTWERIEDIAPMKETNLLAAATDSFGRLLELIQTLRSENGCPWDKKQTPRSFHPYILEEYHEMVHALSQGSNREIADEAGDLIFLVIFVAYMFEQEGVSSLQDILEGRDRENDPETPTCFRGCYGKGLWRSN